jgi:hypothetical protein
LQILQLLKGRASMADCTFVLNGEPLSELKCGTKAFPAFSGRGEHVNRRQFACSYGTGPIPPGTYFIVDRESGGMLGGLRELFTGRDKWFALYAADNRIDDKTFCNDIIRVTFVAIRKVCAASVKAASSSTMPHDSTPCERS